MCLRMNDCTKSSSKDFCLQSGQNNIFLATEKENLRGKFEKRNFFRFLHPSLCISNFHTQKPFSLRNKGTKLNSQCHCGGVVPSRVQLLYLSTQCASFTWKYEYSIHNKNTKRIELRTVYVALKKRNTSYTFSSTKKNVLLMVPPD